MSEAGALTDDSSDTDLDFDNEIFGIDSDDDDDDDDGQGHWTPPAMDEDPQPVASTQESDKSVADPPLLENVRRMVGQLSCKQLLMLQDHWKIFASHASKVGTLKSGSGCSGSGMDWYVLEIVSEALTLLLLVCLVNIVLSILCSRLCVV